jgi:hypothetical protein
VINGERHLADVAERPGTPSSTGRSVDVNRNGSLMNKSNRRRGVGRLPAFLSTRPTMFRAAKSRGSAGGVDRTGGRYGAGLITRVSVITAGEAIGHEAWIDEVFIDQVAAALSAKEGGLKSRWTHPGMSGDGLGKLTSRIFNAQKSPNGRQLFADQHFLSVGHRSPDGDLAGYLMDLAEEDPAAYGLSIVFQQDDEAMQEFRLANTVNGEFRSPDPGNVQHYDHMRLKTLEAADAVDEPAANPAGLFSRPGDVAKEADSVALFALGLSDAQPEVVSLGLDPVRVRDFAIRFMRVHGLELKKVGLSVDGRGEAAQFLAAFGEQRAVWYADGLSFLEAQAKANQELQDQIIAAENRLKAQQRVTGEVTPAGFYADETRSGAGARGGFASKLRFPDAQWIQQR